ncbi:MAG: PQQ-binding-like beta-propeller repeat protein [Sphingomicrobium sp.]
MNISRSSSALDALKLLAVGTAILSATPGSARAPTAGPTATSSAPHSLAAVRFRFKADGAVRGGFAAASGRLFFGTEAGSFYALDSMTGVPAWTVRVGAPVASVPAIRGGTVYFTSWDNELHAVDARTGRERWRQSLGRDVGNVNYWDFYSSSPVITDHMLYTGSGDGRLYAIDLASGRVNWSFDSGARIRSTPAISGNLLAFGNNAGHVIALDARSGRKLWDFATVGAAQDFAFKDNDTRSVITAPIIAGGLVIAGGRDGNVYGIDQATGTQRWRETHDGGSWILGFAADRDVVYSSSGSALIMQAAEIATGKEIWRRKTGAAMFGGIAKAGDVIVTNGLNGALLGLDTRTGTELWRVQMPAMTLSTPLVGSGMAVSGSDDGTVMALDTSGAAPTPLEPMVYSFTDLPAASYYWFAADGVAMLNGAFSRAGYTKVGNAELLKAMSGDPGRPVRKIAVIADTRLPDGLTGAAIRKFLDSGGTIVLLGPNPLSLTFDPKTGEPTTVDDEAGATALGMKALDRQLDYGYNVSRFTPDAASFGLVGQFTSSGNLQRPSDVSLVLATDRFGMASAWARQYRNGGLVIMLPVPRVRPFDTSAYANAIQLLAARSAAGSLADSKR